MSTARSGRVNQAAALLAIPYWKPPAPRTDQAVMLVAYAPPSTKRACTSEAVALIARADEEANVPKTTQVAVLIAYATGTPDQQRSRAWSFTLDGHSFYVLNIGVEGTFVYDTVTQQWAKFETNGFGQWNMLNGTMWGNRIVGGDAVSDQMWELSPSAVVDEGWRDIVHASTGGVQTRSRVAIAVEALRVAASVGFIDQNNGATLRLRFSDNNGRTWSDYFEVALTQGNYSDEIAFRSLGSFAAPGRVFELSDMGGLIRIDGCDVFLDDFDEDEDQKD